MSGADLLVRSLRRHGVEVVFGYPGGQLTPLYDALHRDGGVRHVLARDEQAAGFMADGFARASGRPGVFLAVCGPGVNNAVTPLATAFTDSVPVLCLSGQVPRSGRNLRSGYYHENEQLSLCTTCTKDRVRVETPEAIPEAVDRAFAIMTSGRPGPFLLEVPVDVLRADALDILRPTPKPTPRPVPAARDLDNLAAMLALSRKPMLMVGGGAISSGASAVLTELAERLGAPVFNTAMGKGAIAQDHPLSVGLPWQRATSDLSAMEKNFSPLFDEADTLLALGCRFTQLATGSWTLRLPARVAHVDIDPEELGRHYRIDLGIVGDVAAVLEGALERLPTERRSPWATLARPTEPWQLPGIDLTTPLRRVLPRDAILVADITRLAYILMVEFPVFEPRTFLHPAGYVSMGYGIPAALGARSAFPRRPIVVVLGDGCFLMSGMELATAVQENLPIVVVLINDGSLTLIKAIQQRRYDERYLGVDLKNPDFGLFAQAFGVRHRAVTDAVAFENALLESLQRGGTTLIEVKL